MNIDDQLLAEVKLLAARTHRPIGSILEDAVRKLLDDAPAAPPGPFRLPRIDYQDPGLRPGVDLEDRELMASLLGDDRLAPPPKG